MSFIVSSPRCTRKVLENPERSILYHKNLLYIQPTRERSKLYIKPYQKPVHKIESDTTYDLSYTKYNYESLSPKVRIDYGKHEKILRKNTGKFDFQTVYKLSYHPDSKGSVRKPFIPKSCLSINGCHDMMTVQKLSYSNPGYVITKPFKPYEGKPEHPAPMENKTVMKESYQHFGTPIVQRPPKREFWQTKFKADYQTTNRLSYQYVKPMSKRNRVVYRPKISASMDKDTVYSTSYHVPGRFVSKNAVSSA